jgi:hypothetical protein
VLALHTAVRLGDGTVAGRLAELATRVDGPRAPAAALAAADGDALQAASVQLEQMGDLLAAVDAAAHAAAAYAQRAAAGSADAEATRAHRLAPACQGARTPALITVAQPLPLTRRERASVTLAGQGLSNKQIADRLVISGAHRRRPPLPRRGQTRRHPSRPVGRSGPQRLINSLVAKQYGSCHRGDG